jgi:hypothetical protein
MTALHGDERGLIMLVAIEYEKFLSFTDRASAHGQPWLRRDKLAPLIQETHGSTRQFRFNFMPSPREDGTNAKEVIERGNAQRTQLIEFVVDFVVDDMTERQGADERDCFEEAV